MVDAGSCDASFFETTPPRFPRAVFKLAHTDEEGSLSAVFLAPREEETRREVTLCWGAAAGDPTWRSAVLPVCAFAEELSN